MRYVGLKEVECANIACIRRAPTVAGGFKVNHSCLLTLTVGACFFFYRYFLQRSLAQDTSWWKTSPEVRAKELVTWTTLTEFWCAFHPHSSIAWCLPYHPPGSVAPTCKQDIAFTTLYVVVRPHLNTLDRRLLVPTSVLTTKK